MKILRSHWCSCQGTVPGHPVWTGRNKSFCSFLAWANNNISFPCCTTYIYPFPWTPSGLNPMSLCWSSFKIANNFLVFTESLICLLFFLAFYWLTFYRIILVRIKPSLVATPISEHVSFLTKGLSSKRWYSLRSVTAVINLLTFYHFGNTLLALATAMTLLWRQ